MESIFNKSPDNKNLQVCRQVGSGTVEVLFEGNKEEAENFTHNLLRKVSIQNIKDNITIWTREKSDGKRKFITIG